MTRRKRRKSGIITQDSKVCKKEHIMNIVSVSIRVKVVLKNVAVHKLHDR